MTTEFNSRSLYDIYRVRLQVRDRLCGGMPKNAELIRTWVTARTGYDDEKSEVQTAEALEVAIDETAEKGWVGFAADGKGLFVFARNIKAMFKENMSVLGIVKAKRGSKQVLQHGFEIKAVGLYQERPDRIYLGRGDPDGTDERAIHVMTPQGPRAALKRSDYVVKAELEFEVWVLATHAAETRHIGEAELRAALTLGQENGLGADRSQGHGKFDVAEFEVVQKAKPYSAAKGDEEDKPGNAAPPRQAKRQAKAAQVS